MNRRTGPDLEAALRASLAERARHAPSAGPLAEHIIADVDQLAPARERRVPARERRAQRWRTWTLPLVAAGSVAAVVAAVVGTNGFQHAAHRQAPAVSNPVPTPTPSGSAPVTPAPTPSPTSTTPSSPPATTTSTPAVPGLTHFRVIDLTFVGAEDGWALGTADCLDGSGRSCAAMVRTTDGGQTWTSMTQPPANVPLPACSDPCIRNLRFADVQIGYAYGPTAFFMTTDGGKVWRQKAGGAAALETLDGNVIRVVTSPPCSPPGCHYSVQTAPIGSDSWQFVDLPGAQPNMSVGVTLSRAAHLAFVNVFGHTAGGAQDARSTMFTSSDDGASWTNRGEPCPQGAGTEIDSTALTTAADGSVTLVCTGRGDQVPQFTITSTDGGATFEAPNRGALGSAPVSTLGAASASVLLVSSDGTYRSGDGGRTWRRLGADGGSDPGTVEWIGFESATVGHATDGGTVWTTRDAGLTWTPYTFR